MSPPIVVSTACLPGRDDLAARLRELHSAGLSVVEIGAGVSVDAPGEVASLLRATAGTYTLHGYFPPASPPFVLNLASNDAETFTRSVAMVRRCVEISHELGASYYSVHAGLVVDPTGAGPDGFVFGVAPTASLRAAALARFIDCAGELAEHADRLGVRLLVENHVARPDIVDAVLLAEPGEIAAFMHAVGRDGLGILLDTGHLNIAARTLGFDPWLAVLELEPWIVALHVHENDGLVDQHLPVCDVPWIRRAVVREAGRGLALVVESKATGASDLREQWHRLAVVVGDTGRHACDEEGVC